MRVLFRSPGSVHPVASLGRHHAVTKPQKPTTRKGGAGLTRWGEGGRRWADPAPGAWSGSARSTEGGLAPSPSVPDRREESRRHATRGRCVATPIRTCSSYGDVTRVRPGARPSRRGPGLVMHATADEHTPE